MSKCNWFSLSLHNNFDSDNPVFNRLKATVELSVESEKSGNLNLFLANVTP